MLRERTFGEVRMLERFVRGYAFCWIVGEKAREEIESVSGGVAESLS